MKISQAVKNFYNSVPFPNFDLSRFNSVNDLKEQASSFAKILDRSIPKNASIIDIGTGTGQLAAFLSLRRNCVYGIDFSETSLKKAESLKKKLGLNTLHLKVIDILDKNQVKSINQKFDYILCLGVLHHTENPYQGFKNILKLLKPNGYICLGLYNKVGRIPLKIRRFFIRTIFKNNEKIKKWFIKMQIGNINDKERLNGWWNDQYLHPHEISYTVGKILKWFKKNNVVFMQTLPSLSLFDNSNLEIGGVWNNSNTVYTYFPIRVYKQLTWLWKTHKDGGYWMIFGRKNK